MWRGVFMVLVQAQSCSDVSSVFLLISEVEHSSSDGERALAQWSKPQNLPTAVPFTDFGGFVHPPTQQGNASISY